MCVCAQWLSYVRLFATPWIPHGLQPAKFLSPWNSPGRKTGVGCHALFQGIFPIQELNPGLLHCRREPPGKPRKSSIHLDKRLLLITKDSCLNLMSMGRCKNLGSLKFFLRHASNCLRTCLFKAQNASSCFHPEFLSRLWAVELGCNLILTELGVVSVEEGDSSQSDSLESLWLD